MDGEITISNHLQPLNFNMAPENGTPLEEEILIMEIIRFFQVNHLFNFGGVNLVVFFPVSNWHTR